MQGVSHESLGPPIFRKRGGSSMFRLSRTSVIAWAAVVAVIAALSYALTGVAVPPAAAEDKAKAAPVEFTADGKLKRPVGYRTRADDPMKGWTFTGRTQATEEEVMARVTGQLTRI